MNPDQRRAAIVAAARPLLATHGTAFTTKQIAAAAGVAEGTIFRVFSSMSELHEAIVDDLLDAGTTRQALASIDAGAPLLRRVAAAIEVLQQHARDAQALFAFLHRPAARDEQGRCRLDRYQTAAEALTRTLETVLARDEARFKLPLAQTSAALRAIAISSVHPMLGGAHPSDPEVLAGLFLTGFAQEKP